jgi:two-component system phosphate regulon sensor histidine kinase PhoR
MQRRLRFIFGLLALCLLGIYGFQAYWLYGSYQLAQAEFERTASEALEAVVQQQQLARTNKVFRFVLDNRHGPAISTRPNKSGGVDSFMRLRQQPLRTAKARIDSMRMRQPDSASRFRTTVIYSQPTNKKLRFTLPNVSLIQSISVPSRKRLTDSMARHLSGLVISSWEKPEVTTLQPLARAYHTELHQRGIGADFKLDTLSNTSPLFKAYVSGARDTVAVRFMPSREGYPVRTPPVQLNPVRGLMVAASFPAPTAYILRQMLGSLAGSVALLGLTTGCFALMLSTIFRQKKLAEIKNDFINNMTHELKTPLATVSAAMEALQDFGALHDARKTDTYLTMARQEVRRLSDLVEKVLHIAVEDRPGHALPLHPEPMHPAELVAELVSRHELQAPKPVQFDVEIAPNDTLLLDRLHLAGALHNLLDNAIKYSGDRVVIRIQGQPVADGWQLTVADNGPGIAPGYQDAIFEQFFRVPTDNLHPVKGFGLGLYYVRQVVAGHGGQVSVRSTPGRGSEFVIWLPESVISYQSAVISS